MPPGRCRRWRGCSSPRAKSREAPCAANDSLGGRQLGLGCSRAFDIKARAMSLFDAIDVTVELGLSRPGYRASVVYFRRVSVVERAWPCL